MAQRPPEGEFEVASARFTFTRGEFFHAVRYLMLHRRGFWIGPVLAAFLIVDGVYLLRQRSTDLGWLAIWTAIVIVVLLPLFIYRGLDRRWNRDPSMQVERIYRISDQQFEVTTSVMSQSSDWSMFSELIEAKDFYALRTTGARAAVILPKRGFETAADEVAFRRITTRHLPSSDDGPPGLADMRFICDKCGNESWTTYDKGSSTPCSKCGGPLKID